MNEEVSSEIIFVLGPNLFINDVLKVAENCFLQLFAYITLSYVIVTIQN